MIQMGSNLNVADNTGARKVQCIKVLGGSKKMSASLGEMIMVSIKETVSNSKVKEGDVYKSVIVRTKKEIKRKDGIVVKFFDNSVVLLDNNNEPIGTRIFGVIPREIKDRNFKKIISLAGEVS